jgi:hypothetical protein
MSVYVPPVFNLRETLLIATVNTLYEVGERKTSPFLTKQIHREKYPRNKNL